jgi:hypothetical protein
MPADHVDSFLRVQALADVAHRYAAMISNLTHAAEEAMPHLEGEPRERLRSAILDTDAQLAAAGSALDKALTDLPEGDV